MKTALKTTALISLLALLISFSSCFEEHNPRTETDERQELNHLLLSMQADSIDVDTTDLGVYYVVHKLGEGEFVVPGDTVGISYDGILTNGSLFDSSSLWAPDGIWEFVYGEQELIPGLHEGLSYMNKGAEMEFIIPSWLAYGAYGLGDIGPFQTLIFGVKLVAHKPVNP